MTYCLRIIQDGVTPCGIQRKKERNGNVHWEKYLDCDKRIEAMNNSGEIQASWVWM